MAHAHESAESSLNRLGQAVILGSLLTEIVIIAQEAFRGGHYAALVVISYVVATTTLGLNLAFDITELRRSQNRLAVVRSTLFEWVLLIPVLMVVTQPLLFGFFVWVRQLLVCIKLIFRTAWGRSLIERIQYKPAQMLVASFLVTIAIGTVLLTFPPATTDNRGASLEDALFTATSATCVTGLIVLNTHDDAYGNPKLQSFSLFGQFVILLMIQVGGLGIMTLSTALALLLGRRMRLRSHRMIEEAVGEHDDIQGIVKYIFKMTFVCEGVGALLLFFPFFHHFGDGQTAAYYAVFHSVSAFCNAGFALFGNSLTLFQDDWLVNLTVMALITLGGLGFTVVAAVFNRDLLQRRRGFWRRSGIHVKIVILTSLALTIAGTVVIFYADFYHSLDGLRLDTKLLAALFQSVSLRTCGFNTVDIANIHRVTLIVMVVLMFIGASPGGTGGGVKTSTILVVILSVRAMLLGRDEVEMNGRTIPKNVIYKAVSILVIAFIVLNLFFVALLFSEPHLPMEKLLFEAVSALGTVGLSMGITADLTVTGKVIITFLMFVGRIGPLTLALAVGEREEFARYQYPEGKVIVG